MALFPPLEATPAEVRAALAPLRHDFSVALLRCENPFAVGAIIRIAHNFLAKEVILVGTGQYYAKASMGMEKYENIVEVTDAEALFRHTGPRPVWALERESASESLHAIAEYPREVVLLFGSERFGLPPDVLSRCAKTIAIPIYGVNNSLPVAVAAGIAMHDWTRRKYTT
jgi:tRNA G18 (ribose-2'-O)-methylase SpoU